jgi:hypothetical protein
MAKFNWDRVRTENYARRGGSEYARKERESYVGDKTAVATCTQIIQNRKTSLSKTSSNEKVATKNDYIDCPHCDELIKKGKLGEHIIDFHSSSPSSTKLINTGDGALKKSSAHRADTLFSTTPLDISYLSLTPFTDVTLRDWFFESFPPDSFPVDGVATMGAVPFEDNELDDFFYDSGVGIYIPDENTEILVIGREEWREEDLEELLDKRAGKALKVYSQEMFLSYWASGRDPFEDEKIARKFGEGHPALEFLSNVGFDWPKTLVAGGDGDFNEELPSVGVLKHSGYTVGKSGLDERERREVLRYVYSSQLPVVVSVSYMEEWGKPKSKERLQKMANSVATFCRNEKRKSRPSLLAISDWEDDLQWLHKTFYSGRFMFQWPSVSGR